MCRLHNTTGPCVARARSGDSRVYILRRPKVQSLVTPRGEMFYVRIALPNEESRLKFFASEAEAELAVDKMMRVGL